ncbi:TATA-box binding protein TBP2 [Cardiosporidium cionae]|uniref:TATA-box binding protein TBP2 n=1 Tax=Cardiosporidium cionae TaxID=476202 RepID=A0ABQ7JDE0_9APIC|nr:TATA-box binding protein TBP2 [Cardiosporidium cionae]|eukprot:KAF8822047.1 TATA-box binding protein TBP2 [Cardiosporidium cionae]
MRRRGLIKTMKITSNSTASSTNTGRKFSPSCPTSIRRKGLTSPVERRGLTNAAEQPSTSDKCAVEKSNPSCKQVDPLCDTDASPPVAQQLPFSPASFTDNNDLQEVLPREVLSQSLLNLSVDTSFHFSTTVPTIQNVVASVHLQCEVDLRKVAISTRNAEYNPRKVSAVVIRIRNPRCTGLIFQTGRLLITGTKSESDAKRGGKLMAKIVQLTGHKSVSFTNFKIESIIAVANCGVPVRLEGLANEHKEFCSYEPELFAGLVYRYNPSELSKAVLLIFVSGKIVITGCKSLADACTVFENMYPVVMQFKK